MYFFRFTGITIGTEDLSKQNSNNPFEDPLEKDNPFFEGQEEKTETETATASSIEEINLTPFHGIISKCFEQYLHIYIESQDQNLVELIDRAAQEQKIKGQIISECPYEIIVSPKICKTKKFPRFLP